MKEQLNKLTSQHENYQKILSSNEYNNLGDIEKRTILISAYKKANELIDYVSHNFTLTRK